MIRLTKKRVKCNNESQEESDSNRLEEEEEEEKEEEEEVAEATIKFIRTTERDCE